MHPAEVGARKAWMNDHAVAHPGLEMMRFFPIDLTGGEVTPEKKEEFFSRIASYKIPNNYKDIFQNRQQGLSSLGCFIFEGQLLSRMTLGVGEPSGNEIGMMFHHTYGVPIIPGSSIKGVMRTCAMEMLGISKEIHPNSSEDEIRQVLSDNPNQGTLMEIFGSTNQMSAITIFDALPSPSNEEILRIETWTPHHMEYMTEENKPPTDTESPVPLKLLAVKKGVKFTFAMQLPNPSWEQVLIPLIAEAMKHGFGAKTSQGYGRFKITGESRVLGGSEISSHASAAPVPLSNEKIRRIGVVKSVGSDNVVVEVEGHITTVYQFKGLRLSQGDKISGYFEVVRGKLVSAHRKEIGFQKEN